MDPTDPARTWLHPVTPPHAPKVLSRVNPPPAAPVFARNTNAEIQVLLRALPDEVQRVLLNLQAGGQMLDDLMELNVQIGRKPEAIFVDRITGNKQRLFVVDTVCTAEDIRLFAPLFQEQVTSTHKRVGLPGTLHRLSLTTHPTQNEQVIAVTARVGRAMEGVITRMAPFLIGLQEHRSLLLIGRPGVGKTTLLRELASALSKNLSIIVVVVDKTCEIAGDGVSPHPAIGTARWMPVGRAGLQAQVLREAVENQTPDIIICDEISTQEEVDVARTIAQRGVCLIATVHGSTLPEIVNDSERRNLVGGQHSVTLTDVAAERRADKRKAVAVRLREPAFVSAIELHERDRWVYHPSVRDAVDGYYSGEPIRAHILEPGRSLAAFALPEQDAFSYCLECGRLDTLCPAHAGGPAVSTTRVANSSAGSGGAYERHSRRGGGGGGQRSGLCHYCGEPGHYQYECPAKR